MKKKLVKEVEVDVSVCNICEKEIDTEPFNKTRIEIVKHLFSTEDFDAHEQCINRITREAFSKYFPAAKEN